MHALTISKNAMIGSYQSMIGLKMSAPVITILFVLALAFSRCTCDLQQDYRFNAQLDGNGDYTLYWNFDVATKNISFAVRVRTTGWVGFGLSPDGKMPQSDVVIGWVDSNQRVFLQDRYAERHETPTIDDQQSWILLQGEEENGFTVLRFWRSFSSCDNRDLEIGNSQTSRVIWSYYPDDPISPTGRFPMHTKSGTKSLNFLGGLQNERHVPSDSANFTVRNDKVLIPNNTEFTYWCSYQEHNVPRTGDIYIYKASPLVTPESAKYIQHIVLSVCPSYVDASFSLSDGPCGALAWLCYYGDDLPGWSRGGGTYTFPEDVALHINLQPNQRLFMEVHYDNPNLDSGILDSSGMMYFYTQQPPSNIAGTMTVEYNTFPFLTLIIPPNAEQFNITTTCPNRCHDETFPEEGLTIFSSFHHSNILGKASIAHHNRPAGECDANEELKPIDQNLNFDFQFQETTNLQRPVVLQKDDTISVTCVYDSKQANRRGVTLGGLSRRDEACYVSFNYYPKRHLTYCGTYAHAESTFAPFLNQYFTEEEVQAALSHLTFFNSDGAADAFNRIQWSQENITDFQEAIQTAEIVNGYCWYDQAHPNGSAFVEFNMTQPTIDCRYEAPDQCTNTRPMSCCNRLQALGALAPEQIAGITVGTIIAIVAVAGVLTVGIVGAIYILWKFKPFNSKVPDGSHELINEKTETDNA